MADKEDVLLNTTKAQEILLKNGIVVTLPTFISYIKEYDLGRKTGGRWYVREDKLMAFIKVAKS